MAGISLVNSVLQHSNLRHDFGIADFRGINRGEQQNRVLPKADLLMLPQFRRARAYESMKVEHDADALLALAVKNVLDVVQVNVRHDAILECTHWSESIRCFVSCPCFFAVCRDSLRWVGSPLLKWQR